MRRHVPRRWLQSLALAGVVLGASAAPATAGVFVEVTAITFDRVAHLCGDIRTSGCVIMTGTITCAETGLAELVSVELRQREIRGTDNLDLLDFACSTEPRTFTVIAETFGCVFGERAGCFRTGPGTVEASVSGQVLTTERVLVKRS